MSFAEVIESVRAKFVGDVATPNELTVTHDNCPPRSITGNWYGLEVQIDGSQQVASNVAAGRRYRISGQAIVSMFCPVARGDGGLLAIADLIVTAFRGVVESSPIIYYGVPSLVGDAARGDGWFQRTLTIPFEADVFG